jgi:hypothetical protein
MSNIDEQADPSESYVAPPKSFRGMPIQPYSLGNKMLLAMITREGDPNSFFLFALLYVLTQPRAEVQRQAANKDQIRENVLMWLDSLNLSKDVGIPVTADGSPNPDYIKGEETQAQDLAIEILQEANKNKVDPIATAQAGNA